MGEEQPMAIIRRPVGRDAVSLPHGASLSTKATLCPVFAAIYGLDFLSPRFHIEVRLQYRFDSSYN